MSELEKAMALMAPALAPKGFKPAGGSAGQRRAAEAPSTGTPARVGEAPAPSKPRAIVRAGEDMALVEELLAFVDEVGSGREVDGKPLAHPLHLAIATKTGGALSGRGQQRIYSIANGKVGSVRFKDRADERDNGQRVRNRITLWNRKQNV